MGELPVPFLRRLKSSGAARYYISLRDRLIRSRQAFDYRFSGKVRLRLEKIREGTDFRIIVSLTTIPERICYIKPVIRSLITQSIEAHEIVLALADDGRAYYERALKELNDDGSFDGIRILYTEDIGPHTKLLPVLQEHFSDNCVIITADDDTIYPYDWIETLVEARLQQPDHCIAHRCKYIRVLNGSPAPYDHWPLVDKRHPRLRDEILHEVKEEFRDLYILPTGKGGVLYSPSLFSRRVFDRAFLRLAKNTDDIWFRFMTLINGVPVRVVSSGFNPAPDFIDTPAHGINPLNRVNTRSGKGNDVSIRNVLRYCEDNRLLDIRKHLAV
jgi:hypothetical protein